MRELTSFVRLAKVFERFRIGVPDEFVWEYGSENPADRFYRYFKLRAYTFGSIRCALQLRLNLNGEPPHDGIAQFSLQVDPAALNRLRESLSEVR